MGFYPDRCVLIDLDKITIGHGSCGDTALLGGNKAIIGGAIAKFNIDFIIFIIISIVVIIIVMKFAERR